MSRDRPPPRGLRRVERWVVGAVMAVLAFALEKAVLRSIRRGRTRPPAPQPAALSGSGADITAE